MVYFVFEFRFVAVYVAMINFKETWGLSNTMCVCVCGRAGGGGLGPPPPLKFRLKIYLGIIWYGISLVKYVDVSRATIL